ncbi:hypothetical protein JTB14_024062 [Gonioctena quinquepunctata]|nr:hypothetical protein JTB14_024062 [Gonioctena quinquepunctata]
MSSSSLASKTRATLEKFYNPHAQKSADRSSPKPAYSLWNPAFQLSRGKIKNPELHANSLPPTPFPPENCNGLLLPYNLTDPFRFTSPNNSGPGHPTEQPQEQSGIMSGTHAPSFPIKILKTYCCRRPDQGQTTS